MAYGELSLPPIPRMKRTPGDFDKGHVPHNKGVHMKEWMDGRKIKKVVRIGTENLNKHRPTPGPDHAQWLCKPIVGVNPDGTWEYYKGAKDAATKLSIGEDNVSRCCRMNAAYHVNENSGKVNTDHRYKGIRFYFENDLQWLEKIR